MAPLLELENVRVEIPLGGELRTATHGITLSIGEGEALGLVGESGSGKSLTARTIARLLPAGSEVSGRVAFNGEEIYSMGHRRLRTLRSDDIGFIFQDPRAHLDPLYRIGTSMIEPLVALGKAGKTTAVRRAVEMLDAVGIDDPERRMRQYPMELSGGMLQRVMIASVLLAEPRLILADEPTTALDVTTQAEIVAILDRFRRERGTAVVFITHDLDLAVSVCDRIAVMYAGTIQEVRPSIELQENPWHPYTRGLLASRPELSQRMPELTVIPGRPVSAFEAPPGCAFAPRCAFAMDICRQSLPELSVRDEGVIGSGSVRCVRVDELGLLTPVTASARGSAS